MIFALTLCLVAAVVAVVTALCQPQRPYPLEQQYRFDVALAPYLARSKVSIRRELDRQVWGTGPAKDVTGLRSIFGVPLVVDPLLPPGASYLYDPRQITHITVDGG